MAQTKKRKTRESFGSVRKLPSGRIQASYLGPDGKRYNAPQTFDAAGDARGWLSVQRAKLVTGEWSPVHATRNSSARSLSADTLHEYAQQWLTTRTNRHGEGLRDRTRAEYERLLEKTLTPVAGERLRAITPEVVRTWYASEVERGRKTQAARAYGLLKSVMATALEDGRISSNPCLIRGAQNATTGKKVTPPTPAELQTIVDAITPRYKAAVILAAWGGLRYGEVTELRRRDVLVTEDTSGAATIIVNVGRAVTHTTGKGFVVGSPKSEAGVRAIVMPPHVASIVTEHLKAHTAVDSEALLFPASDGVTHLAASTFTKHFYPARAVADRSDMNFHALRHYGATRYAQTGATLKEIQARLGHSTVAAAMRYQHVADRDAELARRMSEDLPLG